MTGGRPPRGTRGNVAVELALVLPVLLVILAGLSDLGRGVLASNKLSSAVRAGLDYAQAYPDDGAGIQAVVTAAAAGEAVIVTATSACECANGVAGDCSTQCSDGTMPGTYMRIAATQNFSPIFPALEFALGPTLSASASVRTK